MKREERLACILDFDPDNEMCNDEVARRYFDQGGTTRCENRDVQWARNRLKDGSITRASVLGKVEGVGEKIRAKVPRKGKDFRDGATAKPSSAKRTSSAPRWNFAALASEMDTFAHGMEQGALKLNELMCRVRPASAHLYTDGRNMKPWFSAPCLFESRAARVFLAVNPGGEPSVREVPYRQLTHDCNAEGCRQKRFNAWLDESWEGEPAGKMQNQIAVRSAFQALYGERKGATTLRSTPCFEVCPLRTANADKLPKEVWQQSIEWCQVVLERLRPRLVICNGNAEKGFSPWAAVCQMYKVETDGKQHLFNSASLKTGRIVTGPLTDAQVLGIPHLSRFGSGLVYRALHELSVESKLT